MRKHSLEAIETFFRSNTDLSTYVTSLSSGQLVMDTKLTYVNTESITDDKDLATKLYVDDSVSAVAGGLWTDNGLPNGIYYDAQVVGIGTSTPDITANLHLQGVFKYVSGNEGVSKVLVSDADGFADWQTIPIEIGGSDEGSSQGLFTAFNFIGTGVTAVANGSTLDVTITGSVSSFDDLSDVNVAAASTDEMLRFNGSVWTSNSNVKSDGTQFAIGNPTTIDAALHVKDAVGNDIAVIYLLI
jgi:hypothetical protein